MVRGLCGLLKNSSGSFCSTICPLVHENDPVGHLAGKSHFVGDAQHGHAFLRQLDHRVQHLLDHLRIKGRGWFVEQHDARTHAQAAGNRDALLLTARQHPRIFLCLFGDLDLFQEMHRGFLGLLARGLSYPDWRQGQVFEDRQMREQIEVLKHHTHLAADLVDVFQVIGQHRPVNHDLALLMLFQRVEAADQCRLARPRGAGDDDPLALVDGQVDVAQHMECAVPLVHIGRFRSRASSLTRSLLRSTSTSVASSDMFCVPYLWPVCSLRSRYME